ncbi:MAG: PDZ domain-containing protein [Opitutae bacterium]|nr:PDZ domain-containing protein [Opitutae bacterium]MBT7740906.1 PDZ domain-containing protein [Opitutae bacterium]
MKVFERINFSLAAIVGVTLLLILLWPQENHLFGHADRFTLKLDETPLPPTDPPRVTGYADVLSKATPAVVGVYTAQVVRRSFPNASNPLEDFLRRYYGLSRGVEPSRVEEQKVPSGMGSGVIIAPEGYAITNAHVITDQRTGKPVDEVSVKLSDKREFPAEIVGFDKATDIAVLKINASEALPSITLADSAKLRVGDIVFAAGNPLGVGLTVTMGIVSATGRTDLGILKDPGAYENFIQTDAAINQGNSGGALIDAKGRLVGINTAIYSRTGGSIGIGFAIPVNLARSVMTGLIEKGGVQRGFLGVQLEDLPADEGARTTGVVKGSPADRAGIQSNDIIVEAAGKEIATVAELRLAISQTPPGASVPLVIIRHSQRKKLRVTLGSLDDTLRPGIGGLVVPGVTLAPLDGDLRRRFDIPNTVAGLVVTESSGEEQTIRKGVVIVEINGQGVHDEKDARANLRRGLNRFYVWFKGRYNFLPYRIP